jgi:hypothetical protein
MDRVDENNSVQVQAYMEGFFRLRIQQLEATPVKAAEMQAGLADFRGESPEGKKAMFVTLRATAKMNNAQEQGQDRQRSTCCSCFSFGR